MALQLIIQEIKVLGHLDPLPQQHNQNLLDNSDPNSDMSQSKQLPQRKFRIAFGPNHYISKQLGQYYSTTQLCFNEPITFLYGHENHAHLLQIQIFTQHKYGDNSDLQKVLISTIDLSDLTILHGDYVQSNLLDFFGNKIGKLILLIEVFKKGLRFMQKVNSSEFFQKVKEQYEKQLLQVSAASKNIKNLIANNPITNTLMTINSMNLIFDKQDTEVYGRQCFLSIKYGPNIKTYSKIVRPFSKENVLWNEYHQFMKNDDFKFVFTFFFYDQWNNIICKCMGQIKYIIFDETINQHTITMLDKKNNKLGVLMVKFIEKQVQKVKIQRKIEKRINAQEARIAVALQQYNRNKFQVKYNKAVLSEKLQQLQLKRMEQMEAKTKPLNPQQQQKQKQHEKFIELVQKQVIKIQRQLLKRQHQNRIYEKKQKFLPSISPQKNQRDVSSPMKSSSYSRSFAELQRRVKKISDRQSGYGANLKRKQSFLNSFRYQTEKDQRKLNQSVNGLQQYRQNKVKFPKI